MEAPFRIGAHFLPQRPEMSRIDRVERLDLLALNRLADGLEERLAVLLDQRLEERQAEDFSFTLVDARREEIVDIVAEKVAFEERPAAVGFHEQLDRRFLHRLAAEDLGDDALQLSAIALVDEPRSPGH